MQTYVAVGNIAFETQSIDEISSPEIVLMTIYFAVTFLIEIKNILKIFCKSRKIFQLILKKWSLTPKLAGGLSDDY